jgi:hypothetical protein
LRWGTAHRSHRAFSKTQFNGNAARFRVAFGGGSFAFAGSSEVTMFDGIPEHWKEEPWPANNDSNEPVPPIVVFLYVVIFAGVSLLTFYAARVFALVS